MARFPRELQSAQKALTQAFADAKQRTRDRYFCDRHTKPSRAGENRPQKNLLVTQKRLQILKEERIPSSDLVLLFPNCEF